MNISAITFKQLRVFDAVARHGSLARAAVTLFVTKAAVSVTLREPTSGTREQFSLRLEPLLQSWRLGLEFGGNEAIVNAVAAGLGLGFLSEFAVADALATGRVSLIALECDAPAQPGSGDGSG